MMRRVTMRRAFRLAAASVVVLPLVALLVHAQEPREGASGSLLFRREYLPAELIQREAKGLIPIPRTEFEELLEEGKRLSSPAAPEAWIESADYSALFNGNDLIDGRAKWKVRGRATENVLLPLDDIRLAVQRPHWNGDTAQTAVVGATPEGTLAAVVSKPGDLDFAWSLQGTAGAWDVVDFDVRLPPATRSTLTITLPIDRRLESTVGLVSSEEKVESAAKKWTVQLGGATRTRLRLRPSDAEKVKSIVPVRESGSYAIHADRIDVTSRWRLDIYREPLARLEIAYPDALTVRTVRIGEKVLPFRILDVNSAGERRAELHFETPLSGTNRSLVVEGRLDVREATRVSLPRIRLLDTQWLEGTLEVTAAETAVPIDWNLKDARFVGRVDGAVGTSPKTVLALSSAAADVSLLVKRAPPRRTVVSAASLRFGKTAVTARLACELASRQPNVSEWEALVASPWFIDSVESKPADLLEDWSVAPQGNQSLLRLRTRRPLKADEKWQVTVRGHHPPSSAEESLTGAKCTPLTWPDAETESYVSLATDDDREIAVANDLLVRRIDPSSLSKELLDRFGGIGSILLRDDPGWKSARVELREEPPAYRAEIGVRMQRVGGALRREVEVYCRAEAGVLERIRLQILPPPSEPPTWRVLGDAIEEVPITAVALEPAASGLFDVVLPQPIRDEVLLRAELPGDEAKETAVPRIFCPEATAQEAWVEFPRAADEEWLPVNANAVRPRQFEQANSPGETAARRWRYEPTNPADLLFRRLPSDALLPAARVSELVLETHVNAGSRRHRAELHVENHGVGRICIATPDAIRRGVLTGDSPLVAIRRLENGREWIVELPPAVENAVLELRYDEQTATLPWLVHAEPRFPEVNVPIGSRRWSVSAPRGLRLVVPAGDVPRDSLAWMRGRLFAEDDAVAANAATPDAIVQATFRSGDGLPERLLFVPTSSLTAAAWMLFFLVWRTVAWHRMHPRNAFLFAALSGTAFFLLPTAWDPVPRLVWYGVLAGVVARSRPFARRDRGLRSSAERPARLRTAVVATAGLLLILWQAAMLSGQDAAAPVVQRVVFPVDDQGKPAGDYVYLSERFFTDLHAFAQQSRNRRSRLVFGRTEWTAAVDREEKTSQPAWRSLQARLEFEVLRESTHISIPLSRETFYLDPDSMLLNGRRIEFAWDAAGKSFSVSSLDVGRHVLTFEASPLPSALRDPTRLELFTVSSPESVLELHSRDESIAAFPPPTWGVVRPGPNEASQICELGPLSLIRLRSDVRRERAEPSVERLLKIHAYPGRSSVAGKWKFTSPTPFDAVQVRIDSGLELLSAAADVPSIARSRNEAGRPILEWRFAAPLREATVEAHFLGPGLPSGTAFRPPRLDTAEPAARDWIAVDGPAEFLDSLRATAIHSRIAVRDFAEAWGDEKVPALAWKREALLAASTAPTESVPSVDYRATLELTFEPETLRWNFGVDFVGRWNRTPLIRLAVPSGWEVDTVDWEEPAKTTWAARIKLQSGELVVSLPETIDPKGTLRVRGTRTLIGKEPKLRDLPTVRDLAPEGYTVIAKRRLDADASISRWEGVHAVPFAESPPDTTSPREFARFVRDEEQRTFTPKLEWNVTPNDPRPTIAAVTRLRNDDGAWKCLYEFRIEATDGIVDLFRFDWPENWSDPVSSSPDQAIEIERLPGKHRRVIVHSLRPSGDRLRILLESTLLNDGEAAVTAPHIVPLDVQELQQYYVLPGGGVDPPYPWRLAGLQPAKLPPPFAEAEADGEESYRAVTPTPTIELAKSSLAVEKPRLLLKEVRVEPLDAGQYMAVARFTLIPAGTSSVVLRMPADNAKLRQIFVDGDAAASTVLDERTRRIVLRDVELPQVVSVFYTIQADQGELDSPQLVNLTPERTLWSIAGESDAPDDIVAADAARFDVELAMLERALSRRTHPTTLQPWLAEHERGLRSLAKSLSGHLAKDDQRFARWRNLEEELKKHKATVSPLVTETSASSPRAESARLFVGEQKTQPVHPRANVSSSSQRPLGASLLWCAFTIAAAYLIRWEGVRELLRRWPQAAWATLGGAIMLLAEPAWLGLAVMLLAAADSFVWPWAKPRYRDAELGG